MHSPFRNPFARHAAIPSSLVLLAFLGACGRKTEPVAPTPPAVPADVVATPAEPPKPPAPPTSWLVWRQDVGAMGVTALVTAAADKAPEVVSVNKALLAFGGGDVWTFGPATERWPLAPCGDEGVGIARGFRYQDLNLAAADGLAGDIGLHAWSTGDRRPARGASAMHDEFLAFRAQVGPYLLLQHTTYSNTCPVPAGEIVETDTWIFDMAKGALVPPIDVLSTEEKASLALAHRAAAVDDFRKRHAEVAEDALAVGIDLAGLVFGWSDAGQLELKLLWTVRDGVIPREESPGGDPGPIEPAVVAVATVPPAFATGPMPEPVAAWLKAQRELDAGREVGPEERARYGGVGWAEVPADVVPRVRKTLEALRDAPTPDGPTDWD